MIERLTCILMTMIRPVLLGVLFGSWSALSAAHEIPADVNIQVYLKPEGQRFTALIRLPLEALRDIDFATRGPGYLDLAALDPQLEDAVKLWLLGDFRLREGDRELGPPVVEALRVALPGDRSFDSYETARQAVYQSRLPADTDLYWQQALLDVALVYEIEADTAAFATSPGLGRLGLRTVTQIRLLAPDGDERGLSVVGDPGWVSLDPTFAAVFGRFLGLGFTHVLGGMDHLLFVFALLIPLLKVRSLVVVITAFTLAHSLTLAASLFELVPGGLWFPPLVEVLIAVSILFMACENLLNERLERRWLIAFGFGLVHGFGFSFALRETLQFAGDHLATSLIAFNLGIEFGQILVVLLIVPVLFALQKVLPQRGLLIVLSALIAHTAWHWLLERWQTFSAHSISWPVLDQALLAGAMRWLMLLLTAALVVWLVRGPFERWIRTAQAPVGSSTGARGASADGGD